MQAGQAFGNKKAPDTLLCRPRSLSKHRESTAESNREKEREIEGEKEVGTALRFMNNMLPFVLIKTDAQSSNQFSFFPSSPLYLYAGVLFTDCCIATLNMLFVISAQNVLAPQGVSLSVMQFSSRVINIKARDISYLIRLPTGRCFRCLANSMKQRTVQFIEKCSEVTCFKSRILD